MEAVKPEMEKARMADDDGRRAAEGGREERKDARTTTFNFSGQCVETRE